MRRIATAVAAVALAATAHAQAQGNADRGNNARDTGKPPAAAQPRGGPGQAQGQAKGRDTRAEPRRGDSPSRAPATRASRAPSNADARDRSRAAASREPRGQSNVRPAEVRVDRVADRERDNRPRPVVDNRQRAIVVDRRDQDARQRAVVDRRGDRTRVVVVDRQGRNPDRQFVSFAPRRLIAGCPPGLAKKNNGCQPPGQVRTYRAWSDRRPDWWGVRGLDDGRYVYRDGYLLRFDGPRLGGYVPLLGGALGVGNAWPSFYQPVRLPTYYESYYALGRYSDYRYADNVVYRVDPDSAAITSIAALLTGDDFVLGQPAPLGYDVYNVPYPYRAQYYDGPMAMYRYSDGYVYQIDPTTRLVVAAIELIAS